MENGKIGERADQLLIELAISQASNKEKAAIVLLKLCVLRDSHCLKLDYGHPKAFNTIVEAGSCLDEKTDKEVDEVLTRIVEFIQLHRADFTQL